MKPREGAALVLVLAAAGARHAGAWRAPFFADDYLFLEQVRGRTLLQALTAPDPIGNFLRPVSRALYFWLVARAGGESPVVFHAVNLVLFLLGLVLLHRLVRRLAGPRAGLIAAAFVGLHYAADVPLLWVAGSQDLLAFVFGIGALLLQLTGRRAWAAVVFACALLSKETACLLPLVALFADARPGEPWRQSLRRVWPLFATAAVWAVAWIVTVKLRPAASSVMEANAAALPATLAHLAQVAAGLEWRAGMAWTPGVVWFVLPLACVLFAVAWTRRETSAAMPRRDVAFAGIAWAVLGALPVAPVASIWSAYYFLFALAGVGLALGAWLSRGPTWLTLLFVGAVATASANASHLDEFATSRGAWTRESHVNRFYVERAMHQVTRYLDDLRRERPALPARSTLFFANVAGSTGWQTANGPLVRWAYRDSSLRSYYLTEFTLARATRGPVYFFVAEDDTLRDRTSNPVLLLDVAYSSILLRKPAPADAALLLYFGHHPDDARARYWLAWIRADLGDTRSAHSILNTLGMRPDAGPAPELALANSAVARGDTAAAVALLRAGVSAHALDVELHSRLAALMLVRDSTRVDGVLEAYAITVLAPERADGWRKFAAGQILEHQLLPAAQSLDRYFALGGEAARRDKEALAMREVLRRMLPGGSLAGAGLRGGGR